MRNWLTLVIYGITVCIFVEPIISLNSESGAAVTKPNQHSGYWTVCSDWSCILYRPIDCHVRNQLGKLGHILWCDTLLPPLVLCIISSFAYFGCPGCLSAGAPSGYSGCGAVHKVEWIHLFSIYPICLHTHHQFFSLLTRTPHMGYEYKLGEKERGRETVIFIVSYDIPQRSRPMAA